MIQVADRLDDPAGVESVILSLPSYISEAMNTMMENIASINSKVRTHTGTRVQVETMWSAFTVHLKKDIKRYCELSHSLKTIIDNWNEHLS